MALYIENYVPYVKDNKGITTKLPVILSGTAATLAVGGTLTVTGASTFTGAVSNTAGQNQSGSVQSTVFHSGGIGVMATTGAFQLKLVTTETYVCEVFVPDNATITGISLLNGHTTSASGNLFVGLANAGGTIVASSNTTTAQSTADLYQQIPFTAPYTAVGPSKYFIAVQGSQTTGFIAAFNTTGTQNFSAKKVTSETYGTFLTTASYATTTYTQQLGPIADTY